MKKKSPLNISFHNPNSTDVFVKKLVKISAQVAKAHVEQELLHMAQTSNQPDQETSPPPLAS